MRRRLIAILLTVLAPQLVAADPPLTRTIDPVVISTAKLGALPRRHTRGLRLYRWGAQGFEPLRYQFDARDPGGDIELDATEFAFDSNDELVFMAHDSGPAAPADTLPEGAVAGLEIAVQDPRDGGRGFVYLAQFERPPARADLPPYAQLDADGRRARSAGYTVEYAADANVFTALRITPAAGGNGENLLRQTRMAGEPTMRLLFTDLTLRFDERSTMARIEGVKNGPVRAIRRVRLSIDLGRFFPDLPNGTTHTYHYANAFDTPSRIAIPWLVLNTLRAFRFENVVVFDPAVEPLRYWDGANPEGTPLDDAAGLRTDVDHDWWAVRSAAGSILQMLQIPPLWREWGIARGTVAGSAAIAAGEKAVAGYSLLHMTRLRRHGDYTFRQIMQVLPEGYTPGAEAGALAMAHQPLSVAVRPIAVSHQPSAVSYQQK